MKRKIRFRAITRCVLAAVFLSLFVTQVFIPTMNLPEYQKPDAKLKSIKDITEWITEDGLYRYKYNDVSGNHTEVTYWWGSDLDMFMLVDYWVFDSVEEAEKDMMLKRPYFPHNYRWYNWFGFDSSSKTKVFNYRGFEVQGICDMDDPPRYCAVWFGAIQSDNVVLRFFQLFYFTYEELKDFLDGFFEEQE